MTRVKSFLFYAMTLAVLCYSAWELGLTKVSADATATPVAVRRCCTYQADCFNNQTCKTISPTCSLHHPHICVTNPVPVPVEPVEKTPVEVTPVETVP